MKPRASIIIGFTPFHLLPMREVIPWMGGDIYLFHPFIDDPGALTASKNVSFLGGCDNSRLPRAVRYLRAARTIQSLIRQYAKVDIYVPHPHNPLANMAFFHPGVDGRFIYQDGLLNYYDAQSPVASLSKCMGRIVKAAVIGVRYRSYAGHLSGIESRSVSGGFFTHPNCVVHADKFPSLTRIDLHLDASAPRVDGCGTLFLDQPIEQLMEASAAMEVRKKTLDYVNGLGGRVYYKPHYAQGRVRSFDRTWHQLQGPLAAQPAESVAPCLGISNVVSFFTSALANIALSDEHIVCHATAAHRVPVRIDGQPATLADILSGFGVRVVIGSD